MNTLDYEQKKKIADDYLQNVCGFSWDDLGDINSLHDAEDKDGIIELCEQRLADSGFFYE
jgi:hypothetical protein